MATAARKYPTGQDNEPEETERSKSAKELREIHTRAISRFEEVAANQQEIRAHALLCRRFISVPGAMWEGAWGEQFANSIRVEIDKVSKGVDKIVSDYRANRIVPDFRPAGGDAEQETADTLDGVFRADAYEYKSGQAWDNAFEEAAGGGFGAWRLCNEYADEADKDNDEQRVNPGVVIADADQRVYFDGNSKLYDKSDAKWAIVLTADSRDAFEDEYPGAAADWPDENIPGDGGYDWFPPDIVIKAEYYEIEGVTDKLYVFTHKLSGQEQRVWASDIETAEISDLLQQGWRKSTQKRERTRVHKYLMTGAEILDDCGLIAGPNIPIVPVYGKRWFVENIERFRGHISKRMDAQRIYNGRVSKLSETDSLAPREKPIFLAEQLPPNLRELWAKQEQERHPYALVNPVIDPATGEIKAMGPIGTISPPQLSPVTATLLQLAGADLADETEDGADEVRANTSAEAMDIAATRVDTKSAIFLDNMRQSVQRGGEIYLGIAKETYFEPGRIIETMSEDGDDGQAELHEVATEKKTGRNFVRNNFDKGRYKVIVAVTEATATRRDKAVKASLATAQIAATLDPELAQAAVITAVMNQDGDGMEDLQRFARKRGVAIGLVEPNEEEQAQIEAAAEAEQGQPDPMSIVAGAQAQALQAGAVKDMAQAGKTEAETRLARAKTTETLANAAQTRAETLAMGAAPTVEPDAGEPAEPAAPEPPGGPAPETPSTVPAPDSGAPAL